MCNNILVSYGWGSNWQKSIDALTQKNTGKRLFPGRVLVQQAHQYKVITDKGELWTQVSTRFSKATNGTGDYPAVGDWIALTEPSQGQFLIEEILPRISQFSRKVAGARPDEQIVSANVDVVLIVVGAVADFNPRRVERYLVTAWDSGARPVVILSKADLIPDIDALIKETQIVAMSAPVVSVSCISENGLSGLTPFLKPGTTLTLLGSSGVGKSTIINRLMGMDVQRTNGLRNSDGRGRHTTTHRELFLLPSDVCIIDTPGMREIQLWDGHEGVHHAFADIDELAQLCRFRDCSHKREPDCAVKQAIQQGVLDAGRYNSYLVMQREMAHQIRKQAMKDSARLRK